MEEGVSMYNIWHKYKGPGISLIFTVIKVLKPFYY